MAESAEFGIGVFAGGGGTTVEALELAIQNGEAPGIKIEYIVSNNGPEHAEVWQRAEKLGIEVVHISNKTQKTCTLPKIDGKEVEGTISYEASERMLQLADERGIYMYVALGFMRKLVGDVLEGIPIANIHHGPLPATSNCHGPGIDEEVMRQGLDFSGPSFHWMDKRLDKNGLPPYDILTDADVKRLLIDHEPVPVTEEMRLEWQEHETATLLEEEDKRVEKLVVARFVMNGRRQLDVSA